MLAYFRQKLKLLEKFNIQSAAKEAFVLLTTPYNSNRSYTLSPLFQQAKPLIHNFVQETAKGFEWKAPVPNHQKILICHGFDSAIYKFERYIEPLLRLGFNVIAFDAPAHGLSTGQTLNVLQYRNFILEIIEKFGPFEGIIAHSFGGVAAALAAEQLPDESLKKLVLIAPATETTRSVSDFCRILQISPALQTELENLIVKKGGQPISWYSAARVVQKINIPILWIHDQHDMITPYKDMSHLLNQVLPHVTFHITEGLGHSLYNNNEVSEKIIDFLSKGIK